MDLFLQSLNFARLSRDFTAVLTAVIWKTKIKIRVDAAAEARILIFTETVKDQHESYPADP